MNECGFITALWRQPRKPSIGNVTTCSCIKKPLTVPDVRGLKISFYNLNFSLEQLKSKEIIAILSIKKQGDKSSLTKGISGGGKKRGSSAAPSFFNDVYFGAIQFKNRIGLTPQRLMCQSQESNLPEIAIFKTIPVTRN